jgi:hypothetical protein
MAIFSRGVHTAFSLGDRIAVEVGVLPHRAELTSGWRRLSVVSVGVLADRTHIEALHAVR